MEVEGLVLPCIAGVLIDGDIKRDITCVVCAAEGEGVGMGVKLSMRPEHEA